MKIIPIPTIRLLKQTTTVLSLFLISTAVSAQKVVINGNYVVIDNRNLPTMAITDEKRYTTTPSNVTESRAQNSQVYHYFAVCKVANNGGVRVNWGQATSVCSNYDSGDGVDRWRLPTQRELMLMWILQNKLIAAGVETFAATTYWSGSLDNDPPSGSSWMVNFSNGQASAQVHSWAGSDTNLRVRCVRDLGP